LSKICEKVRKIAVCAFSGGHVFLFFSGKLGERASLGEIWAKMMLEVRFDF